MPFKPLRNRFGEKDEDDLETELDCLKWDGLENLAGFIPMP